MLWSVAIAAVAGLVLSVSVRAPGLIAATGVAVAAIAMSSRFGGLGGEPLLATMLLTVVALQGAYLAGVALSVACQRLNR